MRPVLIAAACLCMAACATAPLAPPPASLILAQGDTAADAAYNAAAKIYLARVGGMDPALKAKVKPLLQAAYKVVSAADAADTLGDATTFQGQFAAAQALLSQARALMLAPTSANP